MIKLQIASTKFQKRTGEMVILAIKDKLGTHHTQKVAADGVESIVCGELSCVFPMRLLLFFIAYILFLFGLYRVHLLAQLYLLLDPNNKLHTLTKQ